MSTTPVAANLFTTDPKLCLIGGRHRGSGRIVFPLPGSPVYEPFELPGRGLLWSFTIQRFAPKSPPYRGSEPFASFAVGYVELPETLIVESRLTHVSFDRLSIGMPMELTTLEWRDRHGAALQTYAFRPATAPGDAP